MRQCKLFDTHGNLNSEKLEELEMSAKWYRDTKEYLFSLFIYLILSGEKGGKNENLGGYIFCFVVKGDE